MAFDLKDFQNKLWKTADALRANSGLKYNEFSTPVLGLIFLRFADYRFQKAKPDIEKLKNKSSRRAFDEKTAYEARGILYVPEKASFKYLLSLPEGESIGKAINDAMTLMENNNKERLAGVLPKGYLRIPDFLLVDTMKVFNDFKFEKENGDVFGKVYEYFLGKFASSEGQKGGEFYTPTCLVKLLVEIMKPFKGAIYDPACGSGGMFVQTAEFAKRENKDEDKSVNDLITVFGQEKTEETVRWCKMNLAVHGLEGNVISANSFYEDEYTYEVEDKKSKNCKRTEKGSVGQFDFVLANPPFNVDGVDKERLKGDKRFPFGLPKADNANYLWIQMFYSALKTPKDGENARAGFVMPNSASDARQTEQTIREKIIKDNAVDVMVSVGSNMFHNVTLPCTLWFLDKGKKNTDRKDKVLFLDVREIYTQIDRAHREFTDEQIEFITNIVKLYRGEKTDYKWGSEKLTLEKFPDEKYQDVKGLCKVATIEEIEKQGWSLNAGRYVGVAEVEEEDYVFEDKLKELNTELEKLNTDAKDLEEKIAHNIKELLGV